jgi:hypothetical protein
MPGVIYNDDDYPDDSLFSRPPLARNHAAARTHDPDTSHQAAAVASLSAGAIRIRIYELVKAAGDDGMTVDQIRALMPPMAPSTLSARASDLIRDGYLIDSGRRRATRSGTKARVLVAA